MPNSTWLPVLIIFSGCLVLSCSRKTTERTTASDKVVEASAWDDLQPHLKSIHFSPERFSAKAKVNYRDEYGRFTFSSNLRIIKNEKIWLNASFLGFEVARVLVTRDSVFAIIRWEKIYMAEALEDMEKAIDVSLTFDQMVDVLLGNPLISEGAVEAFRTTTDQFEMEQKRPPFQILQHVGKNLLPHFLQVDDAQTNYRIQATLDDFKPLTKDQMFSYFRQYIIEENNVKLSHIQINITNVDTKEVKRTPFEIPSHYTRF